MVAVPSYASLNVHLGHGSKFIRHVFARRHREASHDKNDSSSSTLFVANVPAGATCEALRDTFEKFGTVNDVVLGGLVQGGAQHVAHVVYEDSRSVNKVENTGTLSFDFDTSHTKTGLDKWLAECQEENQVEPKELLALADGQISNYDAAVQALEEARVAAMNQVDEDGFVTVQPRKAKKSSSVAEDLDTKHRGKGRLKKKKKELLTNFYAFQNRETKRERLANLRDQFEEDKKRIAKMKAERKFKPY